MRPTPFWTLFLAILPLASCTDDVTTGCLPEGCLATLSCDSSWCNRDLDGDGVSAVLDCDDDDPTLYPGATEICGNHRDDNCDSSAICDAGTLDADGDDYGSVASGGSDCDDANAAIHPGAPERCGDSVDEDCDDSLICDGGSVDADGDEYASTASGGTDCDDTNAEIHPGALERCGDTVDDDCDGSIICDGGTTDGDGDGFGWTESGGTDCDDTNAAIHPGVAEDCLTGVSESCGTDACDSGFVRVPIDGASGSALFGAMGEVRYLGTTDGRVYRSDNGVAWTLEGALTRGSVTRILEASDGTLVIGVKREELGDRGVWLVDSGHVPQPGGALTGLNGGEVTDLALTHGTPFGLYVTTTGGGLYKSVDGGQSFTTVPGVDAFAYAVAIDPGDFQRLVVVTDMTVSLSTDDATTFTVVMPEIPVVSRLQAARLVTDVDENPNHLYLLLDDGGVYLSPDFGATFERTWTSAASIAPRDLAGPLVDGGELAMATRDRGLLLSSDGGTVWQPVEPPLGPNQRAVVARWETAPEVWGHVVAGARGPVLVQNGVTRRLGRGLDGADVRQIVIGPDDNILAAGGDGTLWVSVDSGAYFHPVETDASGLVAAAWRAPGILYAVSVDGTLLAGPAPFGPLSVVATFGTGQTTAAAFAADGRLAVATGGLQSQLFVVDPTAAGSPAVDELLGVPASVVDAVAWRGDLVLAGTRSGQLLRELTAGADLAPVTTSPTGGSITTIMTAATGPVYVTVGTATGGLFESTDGGDTFASVGSGTGSTWLRAGCLEPTSGTLGMVGLSAAYASTNQGADWSTLSGPPAGLYGDPLPIVMSCTLEPRGADTRMWLATLAGGVWLTRLP